MATIKPYETDYSETFAFFGSRGQQRRWLILGVVLLGAPLFLAEFHLVLASSLFIILIGAIALNLLMGVAGTLSLGAAAFLAVGAVAATVFQGNLHLPFPLVLLGAGLVSALIGAIVALFTSRLHGLYVVMATFALHFVVMYGIAQYQTARVGISGWFFPRVELGPWTSRSDSFWYYVTLAVALMAVLIAANLMRSGVGRSWLAMRDRDLVAEALGVNLFRTKVAAFMVSSFLFGVAGALNAYNVGYFGADSYDIHIAIQYVAMIIIGGMGRLLGSVIGAAFVVLLPYIVRWFIGGGVGISFEGALGGQVFEVQAGLYGLAIIVFMMLEPGGLAALWEVRVKRYFTMWPFRRRLSASV